MSTAHQPVHTAAHTARQPGYPAAHAAARRPAHTAAAGPHPRYAPPAAVPWWRLVLVELRKSVDTRAGAWLLAVLGLLSVAAVVLVATTGDDADRTFGTYLGLALFPSMFLLPVLGVLSMTSEWSQRTALGTFTLTPARGRVVAAKLAACVALAVGTVVVAAAAAAVATLAAGPAGGFDVDAGQVARYTLVEILYVLMGAGFGAVLGNSPAAIVLFLALPTVWSTLGATIGALRSAAEWLDIHATAGVLTGESVTGGDWGRLGVAAAVWIVLPLVAGTVRVVRREVS